MATKKILGGVFILAILTASIYFMWPGNVKIDVQPTYTEYSVWENEAWVSGGKEYVYLYNGSSKLLASSRNVSYSIDGDLTKIIRTVNYKNDIKTIHTYIFNTSIQDITLVPIRTTLECFNCQGLIVDFEFKGISYDGITREAKSPESFGHRMKIEWEYGYYYAKITNALSDKIVIKYRPLKSYVSYDIRVFDPISVDDIFTNLQENLPSGMATFNVTVPGNNNVNLSAIGFQYNEVCGHVINTQILIGQEVNNGSNITYQYIVSDTIGKGKQSVRIVANIQNADCGDNTIGHKIDWIPTFTYLGVNYTQDKWAWWNQTSEIQSGNINCTSNSWTNLDNGSSTVGYNYNGYVRQGFLYDSNLVLYHEMENNRSETCYHDGTLSGVTSVSGKIGNAYNFNGTIDRINISDDNRLDFGTSDFTVEAWIKPVITSTSEVFILSKKTSALEVSGFHLAIHSNKLLCGQSNLGAGTFAWTNFNTMTDFNNTWVHVVCVVDYGVNASMYINGTAQSNLNHWTSWSSMTNTIPLYIGGTATTYDYKGDIDEVRIYNRTLSSTEVGTLYSTSGVRFNTSANMFYSKINQTSVNYTAFNMTLNSSDVNASVMLSANNGTNYTSYLTSVNNSIVIPFSVQGNLLSFIFNLTGSSNYSPLVYGFGILNATGETPNTLNIDLNYPENNTNWTEGQTLTFNYTVYNTYGWPMNISLYINGVLNKTNNSVANNTIITHSMSFTNGTYNWFVNGTDNSSITYTTSNRTFTVYDINASYCSNISSLIFNYSTSSFNLTTFKLTEYNVYPKNFTNCLFNITNPFAMNITLRLNQTSANHIIECNGINLTDSFQRIMNDTVTGTINCTMDYINATNNYRFRMIFGGI